MGQDTPIVEYLHKAKGLVNDFKNLSDPTKYFERKSEPKPGQKEFEEATKFVNPKTVAKENVNKRKVGGSVGNAGTSQKKAFLKKSAQRKKVSTKR